jgi:hypothetical protein
MSCANSCSYHQTMLPDINFFFNGWQKGELKRKERKDYAKGRKAFRWTFFATLQSL